jgi:hypothetical protein
VDPITGLDDVKKRKFLTLPGLEIRSFGRPAGLFIDCAIPAQWEDPYDGIYISIFELCDDALCLQICDTNGKMITDVEYVMIWKELTVAYLAVFA